MFLRVEKDGQKIGVAFAPDDGGDVDFYGMIVDGAGNAAMGEGIYTSVEQLKIATGAEYMTVIHKEEFLSGKDEAGYAG